MSERISSTWAPGVAPAGRVLRLDLEYDGAGFAGWAHQPGLRTVEGTLREGVRNHAPETARPPGDQRTPAVQIEGNPDVWREYARRPRLRQDDADAIRANQHAIHEDESFISDRSPEGVYPLGYYPHNYHFMAFAAMMAGMSEEALHGAKRLTETIDPGLVPEVYFLEQMPDYRPRYALVVQGVAVLSPEALRGRSW